MGPDSNSLDYVVYHVRLPRFCLAALLGAGLGLAGTLLQLATKNPLSEPELLGDQPDGCLGSGVGHLSFRKSDESGPDDCSSIPWRFSRWLSGSAYGYVWFVSEEIA